jgi:hypothetical protein
MCAVAMGGKWLGSDGVRVMLLFNAVCDTCLIV